MYVAEARRFWNSLRTAISIYTRRGRIATYLLSNHSFRVVAFAAPWHSMYAILRVISQVRTCIYAPVLHTYPLLLPLTLCSENVISLWSSTTPRVRATCRRSSSVVHCENKRIHRVVSDIVHT